MASFANIVDTFTHDIDNHPIPFNLAEKEGLTIVPQPPSNDPSKVETWQQQMLIPFMVVEKLFAFHRPLPDERTQPKKVLKEFLASPLLFMLLSRRMASSISRLWT